MIVVVVLLSPVKNSTVYKHLETLLKLKDNSSLIDIDLNFQECNGISEEGFKKSEDKFATGLHKTSIFYIHFKNLLDGITKTHEFSSYEGSTNEYCSEKFLNMLLLKYIPF